ncbi:MAG TPA: hypothetical protein VLK25_06050 [Allosphingosinicella sp.]|nr:hypothetical protein [Allosphingosinicella sp.]
MLKRMRAILYRALQLLVLAVLLYGFAQTLPLDLALLFAGDSLLYLEIATAAWLAAQATRFRFVIAHARMIARRAVRRTRRGARRLAQRARRIAASRKPADDPDRAFVFAYA